MCNAATTCYLNKIFATQFLAKVMHRLGCASINLRATIHCIIYCPHHHNQIIVGADNVQQSPKFVAVFSIMMSNIQKATPLNEYEISYLLQLRSWLEKGDGLVSNKLAEHHNHKPKRLRGQHRRAVVHHEYVRQLFCNALIDYALQYMTDKDYVAVEKQILSALFPYTMPKVTGKHGELVHSEEEMINSYSQKRKLFEDALKKQRPKKLASKEPSTAPTTV
jgi:hypothetical protein